MAIARRPISSIARVALRDVIFRRRSAELWGYRLLSVQAIRHRHADLSLSIPRYSPSLPLDCARRFRGHVVDDTIDALDLVDDAGCHVSDEFHLERVEIGRHTVCRGYRAQCHDMVVSAKVSHHAHAAHRQQHRKRLPDVVIEPRAPDLFDEDLVGKPQDVELLARDLARATDRKTRAREGMPADESLGEAELAAEHADFVLEQLAQGLDELHVHPLWQASNIVVRLDGHRRPAGE